MKKIIFTAIALTLAATQVTVQAQDNAITKFFGEYEKREDVTQISLTGKAFDLASKVDATSDEMKDFKKFASQIKSLRIIVDDKDPAARETAVRAKRTVSTGFEDLVTVSEKETLMNIMVKEANGIVSELLILVGTEKEFIIVDLIGAIKLSDIGELTKQVSAVGKNVFAEVAYNPETLKVYPNPVVAGAPVSIRLPEEMEGADVRIFDASGREVEAYRATAAEKKFDTVRLKAGVYVIKAIKGDSEMSQKIVIQ